MSALDGLQPILEFIRDMHGMAYERLETARDAAQSVRRPIWRAIEPPDDLADVHATLASAVHMAREACERRRRAVVVDEPGRRARTRRRRPPARCCSPIRRATNLVTRLFPPKFAVIEV